MDGGKLDPEQPNTTRAGKRVHSEALWRPRETSAQTSVAEYSRFVGRMKIALPAVAGVILLLVFLVPMLRGESDRFRVGVKDLAEITSDTLSMINARYVGTDDAGRPFTLTAASARERSSGDRRIDLIEPHAELTLDDGVWLKISATRGVYDRDSRILDLGGQVDVIQEQGYEVHSSEARVSMKDRVATGNAPVWGKGSFGVISGEGFSITENGDVVTFTGPATLVLETQSDDKAADAMPSLAPKSMLPAETKP